MTKELSLPADTPIFLQPWWLDATGLPWQQVVVYNGEAISGIWPVFPERKYGISLQRNPPLCPYLGPCVFFPNDLKHSRRESFEHQTITALLGQLPRAQVVRTALQPGLQQVGLFTEKGFSVKVRQTFLMNLQNATKADLLSRLHPDFRRNIRKTEKEFTVADEPEQVQNLYHFQQATLASKGLKMQYGFPYLNSLFNAAHRRGQAALWCARKAGVVQALLWHIWDERRAYYLMGARNPAAKDMRALTALIFHAMNESRISGKEMFDFEGSMDPGVEHFFRHFGGRKSLYLVLEKTDSVLWKMKEQVR